MNNLLEFLDNNNLLGHFFHFVSNNNIFYDFICLIGLVFIYFWVSAGITYLLENVIEKNEGFFKMLFKIFKNILTIFLLIIFSIIFLLIPITDYFYESKEEKAIKLKIEAKHKKIILKYERLNLISEYYDSIRSEIFKKEKIDWIKNGGVVCSQCSSELMLRHWNSLNVCDKCFDEAMEAAEEDYVPPGAK
jgi:hypothetical protein